MRRALRPLAALALVAAVGLAGVALYDRATRIEPDYSPVAGTSAVDGWTPPWATPAGEPEPAAEPVDAGPAERDAGLPGKWMVIGWDGADWDLVLPLLERGELPNLERLMRTGAYGTMRSMVPTVSPAIWTTVATGVSPAEHGITHFYNQQPRLARWLDRLRHLGKLHRRLFTNADRRAQAVWNELDEIVRKALVVGYHNTFPVEAIDGMMVSNYLVQDSVGEIMSMDSGEEEQTLATGLVHPREHLAEVLEIQAEVNRRVVEAVPRFASVAGGEVVDFVRRSRRLDPAGDEKPYFLVRAWAYDTIVAEVADAFFDRVDPDLAMVHFQGVDWACHRFYYYRDPEAFADADWPEEERRRVERDRRLYAGTVDAFYVYLDEWLGRLLEHRDPETAVLVLSDHGFQPAADPRITGEHDSAPPGMFVLEGPGVAPGPVAGGASVYDVLPTLMAGLGLPVAEDLEGEPLREAFRPEAWAAAEIATVPTYGQGDFVPPIARPDDLDADVLQQLESLGYLD